MRVLVISAERSVFDGDAEAVVAPAYDGLVGILPRHAPLITLLGTGTLRITSVGGATRLEVAGGFLKVSANVVKIVARRASTIGS